MSKFRKKPIVIEAFQLPQESDDNVAPFHQWATEVGFDNYYSERDGELAIPDSEGVMIASPGDWIIKALDGKFYPCSPDVFEATYEPA